MERKVIVNLCRNITVMDKKVQQYLLASLSGQDIAIVQMVANEKSSVEIGKELGLSPRTIETITYQLRKKFKFRSSIGLVVLFFRNKLIK